MRFHASKQDAMDVVGLATVSLAVGNAGVDWCLQGEALLSKVGGGSIFGASRKNHKHSMNKGGADTKKRERIIGREHG